MVGKTWSSQVYARNTPRVPFPFSFHSSGRGLVVMVESINGVDVVYMMTQQISSQGTYAVQPSCGVLVHACRPCGFFFLLINLLLGNQSSVQRIVFFSFDIRNQILSLHCIIIISFLISLTLHRARYADEN
jgi:hypothetical protein